MVLNISRYLLSYYIGTYVSLIKFYADTYFQRTGF